MNVNGSILLKQLMIMKVIDFKFWDEIKDIPTEKIDYKIIFKIDMHDI